MCKKLSDRLRMDCGTAFDASHAWDLDPSESRLSAFAEWRTIMANYKTKLLRSLFLFVTIIVAAMVVTPRSAISAWQGVPCVTNDQRLAEVSCGPCEDRVCVAGHCRCVRVKCRGGPGSVRGQSSERRIRAVKLIRDYGAPRPRSSG